MSDLCRSSSDMVTPDCGISPMGDECEASVRAASRMVISKVLSSAVQWSDKRLNGPVKRMSKP